MLHVPGMPEGVHVSFSPEDQPVSAPARPDRYIPPALVGAGTPSEALTALLDAHELAYGHALCSEAYGLPDLAERRQAEEEAFRALLHTPMHTDADRVAYAIVVISRQMYSLGDASATERDHPMAVAYRNLRFGEHVREPEELRRVGRRAKQKPETAADPILAAIDASHAATAACDAYSRSLPDEGLTKEQLERDGALNSADLNAQMVVWRSVPTTSSGRHALVEFARAQVARRTNSLGAVEDGEWLCGQILDAFAAMINDGLAGGEAEDPAALAVLSAIEQEWATQIAQELAEIDDISPEADARDSVRLDRKFALLDAAAALPVGSNAAQRAKALALAWDYSVDVWRPKLTREQHKRDGRLVIDLMHSLTGKASTSLATAAQITGPETPHLDLSGYTVAQLCALFDVYERAEDQFHTAAWWPKLGAAGSQRVTDEGDRCSTLKGAVADELQKRKPGRESDADERAEKLLRREIVKGDWDATAHLACSLRNEVAACQGKH